MRFTKEAFDKCADPDGVDGRVNVASFGQDVEGIGTYLTGLKQEGFDYRPCLTVAEAFGVKRKNIGHYIGKDGYFDIMFDFTAADLDYQGTWLNQTNWTIREWNDKIMRNQMDTQPFGWCANFLENHDQPRATSKYLKDHAGNPDAVKTLGAMYFFLRGVPFIYQGQELGLTNFLRTNIGQFDDISSLDMWKRGKEEGLSEKEILRILNLRSRDHGRTPFPWNDQQFGGFSDQKPWIDMTQEYPDINAESEEKDPDSILNFYKDMIAFRQKGRWKDCFLYGSIAPLASSEKVIAYIREYEVTKLFCWFNFSDEQTFEQVPEGLTGETWHTGDELEFRGETLVLKPWQSVICCKEA